MNIAGALWRCTACAWSVWRPLAVWPRARWPLASERASPWPWEVCWPWPPALLSAGHSGESAMRLSAALIALLVGSVSARAQSSSASELCGQAGKIASELATISGLKLRHAVPCDFITKERVNAFLKKRVKQVAGPEELRAQELTLKKFGLVPPDFNLSESTVDLLTEQAAAFYDYDKKKLFITETTSAETQEPVLAHELSHAIADQNFNLGKYI